MAQKNDTLGIMLERVHEAFEAKDFPLDTNSSNFSEITLSTRYPVAGSVMNTVSEMVIYILEGNVTLHRKGEAEVYGKSSVVLIKPNEKYFWEPQETVTMLIFSTPPWTPEQQRVI